MIRIPVTDPSQVREARRSATDIARAQGLDEADVGRVAIIATEMATNLVKHAGGGQILMRGLGEGREIDGRGIEVLGLDTGPGMANVRACLADGYSTAGSPGTGLGAIARLSAIFDVFSAPGLGTAVLSRAVPSQSAPKPPAFEVGALSVMKPGEERCGDAWATGPRRFGLAILVVDGLGHGPGAADAADAAVAAFQGASLAPADMLQKIHGALRSTRGAAAAVAEVHVSQRLVLFAGIGNIAGAIIDGASSRRTVSLGGIAGHEMRKVTPFTYPWSASALLVLHSDGLVTHWTLDRYPGLVNRHPSLIAGVLYRDFTRGRDDVTVVVVRQSEAGATR